VVHWIPGGFDWSLSEVGQMMFINFIVNQLSMSNVDKLIAILKDR